MPLSRIFTMAGLCSAGIMASSCQDSSRNKEPLPNIIILLADDLGYGDLGCYGSKTVNTPVLDKMAADGIRFTDFYAGSAVSSPSRAALMTGRFPLRVGIYTWINQSNKMHLHRNEITIPELLKTNGYSTAHFGKWHLSNDFQLRDSSCHGTPAHHGFDYWLATGNNANPSHHNPDNFIRNGRNTGVIEGYSSHIVVDDAILWLENNYNPSKPFFINCWFHEPHKNVAAPHELCGKYKHTKHPDYYGCIENMDLAIGRLLDKIESMRLSESTIIIFMSDNGSYLDDGNNDPLSGKKATLWEGGIRVPGIISWKGKIKSGLIEATPAGVVDILPTLCELSGTRLPEDRVIDGESLVPLMTGKMIKRNKPLYWFYSPARPVCVIRDGNWCLVSDPVLDIPVINRFNEEWIGMIKETELTNFRLYNLREDIKQENDVSQQNMKILESLKRKMIDLHNEIIEEAIDWRYFECPDDFHKD